MGYWSEPAAGATKFVAEHSVSSNNDGTITETGTIPTSTVVFFVEVWTSTEGNGYADAKVTLTDGSTITDNGNNSTVTRDPFKEPEGVVPESYTIEADSSDNFDTNSAGVRVVGFEK
jgi:hypothetical protein